MQLYTASWFTQLPPEIARIGISRGTPRGQSGYRMYRKLAPGPWFRSVDVETYYERYAAQLDSLSASQVVEGLLALSESRPLAMLCFESPEPGADWCHRAMVSIWLHERLGLDVPEYGLEEEGCGWSHPKLPPFLRRADAGLRAQARRDGKDQDFHRGPSTASMPTHFGRVGGLGSN